MRSLDHVLKLMLERADVGEVRTPQGCKPPYVVTPFANVGVWAVRPSERIWHALSHWMVHSYNNLQCGIGIQTAAQLFFNPRPERPGPGGSLKCAAPRSGRCWIEGKLWQHPQHVILALHAGCSSPAHPLPNSGIMRRLPCLRYNAKAGAGVMKCLSRANRLNHTDLHVVHWTGERKPQTVTRPLDPYERRAHVMYMAEYAQQSQFSPPPPHNLSQHRHVASQLPMACTSSLDQLGSLRCTSALRRRELATQAERGHNCISLRFCLEFTGAHNRRACWRNVFRYGCERTCGGCANMSYGLLAVPPSARPLRESSVPPALT